MSSDVLSARAEVDEPKTGITDEDRRELVHGLSMVLAGTYTLYLKTQGCHWNVVGPLFYSLHKLTEEQYQELAAAIDEIAERIRALGFPCPASYRRFAALSPVLDDDDVPAGDVMVAQLISDHETLARAIRDTVADAAEAADDGTADLLTDRLRSHEKAVWMLRALSA